MSHKNYLLVGFAIALLTLCALPVKAQFEFGPTAGVGAVMDKPIQGVGLAADLGVSARYTFLKDAPVSIQLRLDATYGYLYAGSVCKNVIQHVRFGQQDDRFAFAWQDHMIRVPLTVGVRLNNVLGGKVSLRVGGYYGRGIAGKVRYNKTPEGLSFPEFDSYKSNTIKGAAGYEGNFITLAQNEHRLGVLASIDVNIYKQLDLSLYYMGDLVDSWDSINFKPAIKPNALKLGLSYWF